jgi:hypothetical protein
LPHDPLYCRAGNKPHRLRSRDGVTSAEHCSSWPGRLSTRTGDSARPVSTKRCRPRSRRRSASRVPNSSQRSRTCPAGRPASGWTAWRSSPNGRRCSGARRRAALFGRVSAVCVAVSPSRRSNRHNSRPGGCAVSGGSRPTVRAVLRAAARSVLVYSSRSARGKTSRGA